MINLDYLLNSNEPWVEYRTLIDLMCLDENQQQVILAKKKLMNHPYIVTLINDLQQWPGTVVSSHKSAGQLYHKLAFLADIGLKVTDHGLKEVLEKVIEHRSEEGLIQLPNNIPIHFGGSGKDLWAWALCDAPLLLYSFVKMNFSKSKEFINGIHYLLSLIRDNGWPCAVSKELGKFRGPGKKEDPCPYANLLMLKLLSQLDEYKDCEVSRTGVECLLTAWEKSRQYHPYMFFMGTDFSKLKAPFIWYDILHVIEILSHFSFALKDQRYREMIEVIHAKADKDGLYTPESVWKAWGGWDFGQKKLPSSWITFLVTRINHRK